MAECAPSGWNRVKAFENLGVTAVEQDSNDPALVSVGILSKTRVVERKVKNEKNKNVIIEEELTLSANEIKEIKRVISFK